MFINKLIECNRGDLAEKLEIQDDYNKILLGKDAKTVYNEIKDKDNQKIKGKLNIPSSIDTSDFKLYEFAIVKDRLDWYEEFIKYEDPKDIEKLKKVVIQYNAISILDKLLSNKEDFNNKALWKKASKDARKCILKSYIDNKTLEEEIIKAAQDLNISMVSMALKDTDEKINGLLHIAAQKNNKELAKVVIDKYGIEAFKQKNENVKTAYDVALENNNVEMLTYFIMKDAEIKYIDKPEEKLKAREKLTNEIIKEAEKVKDILKYDEKSAIEEINKLSKEEINKQDKLGNTILHYALELNSEKIVESLIKKGANVNIKNSHKESPLYLAIKYADKKIVERLIKNKADVHEKFKGKSMLHYAMKRKLKDEKIEREEKESVAIKLMEKGVIDLTPSTMNDLVRADRMFNGEKMTQLMYNISRGNEDTAETLVKAKGIDLKKVDEEGITAYGYALNKNYKNLIKIMEEKVQEINKKEKIEKDFFGITDKETAAFLTAGAAVSAVGMLAKKTKIGGIVYDYVENTVLEEVKKHGGEKTRKIIEGMQDGKQKVTELVNSELVQNTVAMVGELNEALEERKQKGKEKSDDMDIDQEPEDAGISGISESSGVVNFDINSLNNLSQGTSSTIINNISNVDGQAVGSSSAGGSSNGNEKFNPPNQSVCGIAKNVISTLCGGGCGSAIGSSSPDTLFVSGSSSNLSSNNQPIELEVNNEDCKILIQGKQKPLDSKIVNDKTYVRLSDDNLKAFEECFNASLVHKDKITRVKVEGKTYELHLGDKTKDGYPKIKVIDNKNYILLTYLARDLAKCPVVWIEELREICVVKGEYLGNGLVKGKKTKDGYELINVYGENLCTVRRDPWQNTIIPVYTKGKDEFYIMDGIGQIPALVKLDKDALIMPKSSWKSVDLSLKPMEIFHGIMNLLGPIPVIGIGADIANATAYAMEKDYVKMGIYLGFATLSIIPLVSQSSKTLAVKITKGEGEKLAKNTEKITMKEVERKYVEGGIVKKEVAEEAVSKTAKVERIASKTIKINDLKKPLANRGISDFKLKILEEKGVKFTKKRLVEVYTFTIDNKVYYLELGNPDRAGLAHIKEHGGQLASKLGLTSDEDIINAIGNLLMNEPDYDLIRPSGPTKIYIIGNKEYLVLGHGDNGFIITFFYTSDEGYIKNVVKTAKKIISKKG